MDERIMESLVRNGVYNDAYLMANVREVLEMERTLDEAPPTLSFLPVTGEYKGGCAETFKVHYRNLMKTGVPDGEVRIQKRTIKTDPPTIYVLKSLLKVGITRNEKLALACRRLFLDILTGAGDTISVDEMLTKLQADDYYSGELISAITECVAYA